MLQILLVKIERFYEYFTKSTILLTVQMVKLFVEN